MQSKTLHITRIALIAAVYASATILTTFCLQGLAWGPVQLRVSEAVCVLALFFWEAIPGLGIGCVIANLVSLVFNGTGALGLFDVFFGSAATVLGAYLAYKARKKPLLALAGPVLSNALIVPTYLPILCMGLGFYTIPFTTISLDGAYVFMYIFGFVSLGIGEACVMYVLGLPLYKALLKSGVFKSQNASAKA